ncbi:M28 family peptidase [bacterium]|nr:M28 family peptidase [bacterium]
MQLQHRIICTPLLILLTLLALVSAQTHAQSTAMQRQLMGSAFLDNASYDMLERLSDEAGGRWIGSKQNKQGMQILMEELLRQGLKPRMEKFTVPGWVRGEDEVRMITPSDRVFRAVALGYVDRTPEFETALTWCNRGYVEDFDSTNIAGNIALVTQEKLGGRDALLRMEVIRNAANAGARAVLFINNKKGGMVLCGMGNFSGDPTPIPAFSITWEEGQRLYRLLERNVPVRMRITTNSYCTEVQSANVVCTLPGASEEKIVIGAHFDSWDIGQGSIDNGLGTAILFDVARILASESPGNARTIEFVWFNGEEMGLWGARRYVEMHEDEPIHTVINMDMTGSINGFNAMGNKHLLPFLEELNAGMHGFEMSRGVISTPWTASDHAPFMLAGIPAITPLGHLDKHMVETYHDFGDTFDLVNRKYLSEVAGVVSILANELANRSDLPYVRRNREETRDWLIEHKLDEKLKRTGEWTFD